MSMRNLVTGGAACAIPGISTPSNPFGALANAVLGSSSRAQELKGLPGSSSAGPDVSVGSDPQATLATIPGSEHDSRQFQHPDTQNSEFLRGFRAADGGGFADAWGDVHRPPTASIAQGRQNEATFSEFEEIYNNTANGRNMSTWDGPPQRALPGFLHSFLRSSVVDVPFGPAQLPVLGTRII